MVDPVPPYPLCSEPDLSPDADAVIRLGASRDRMKLCVVCYTPARGRGRPLDAEFIRQAARQAGVTAELYPVAVDRVVEMLLAGEEAREVVIARGMRPCSARDARLEPLADLSRPVFTGMLFGRLHPARQPREGCDLGGNTVSPACPAPPADLGVPEGGGCVLGEDGMLKATAFGQVVVADGEVRVVPAVSVSPDGMQVTATIHDRDALGVRLVVSRIKAELKLLGLMGESVRIAWALDEAWAARKPVEGAILATGRPPAPGRDAWLEMLVMDRDAVGTLDNQGRMDWRERGFHPTVEAGQDIARLHPADEGVPGLDVYGREVPPQPGRNLPVRPGRNVEALEDGVLFRAQCPGVALVGRGRVEVSECLDILGDVDMVTGNIRLQQGSVRVRGSVRTGCTVEVPDCVLVGRVVEDARIDAGADVEVHWGVCMDPEGTGAIRAGGTVTASFAQNARISAGGDVVVHRYVSHSDVQAGFDVRAGGWVRVTGVRGRIMGGTVVAGEGIEVQEVGSPLGVATTLVLNQENDEALELVAEKRQLRHKERQIAEILSGLSRKQLASLDAEQQARLRELTEQRTEALARIRKIGHRLAELAREFLERGQERRIVVRGVAHPGVVVKMGGKALRLSHSVAACQFFWNGVKRSIVMSGL